MNMERGRTAEDSPSTPERGGTESRGVPGARMYGVWSGAVGRCVEGALYGVCTAPMYGVCAVWMGRCGWSGVRGVFGCFWVGIL